MSIYDPIRIGPIEFSPTIINADSISIDVLGEGIYIEDGALYIPVKLWEQMQHAEKEAIPYGQATKD